MNSDNPLSYDLPPRPDPETGEPFPPHAPVYEGIASASARKSGEIDSGDPPEPPPGQGPTFAWYQATRKSAVAIFFICFIVFTVLGGLYAHFAYGDAVRLAGKWWIWAILVLFSLPAPLTAKGDRCSAGADWLRDRKAWVRIYELDSIKAKPSASGLYLDLRDKDGRDVDSEVMQLQYNRRLWDLLYNGLLHSAANGATVNGFARRAFRLPDTTAPGSPNTGGAEHG